MIRRKTYFLLMLIAVLWIPGCETEIQLTPEEELWLIEHNRTIRVAKGIDAPPLNFTDPFSNHLGLAVDYLNLIASKLKVKIEPVQVTNWLDGVNKMSKGELDIISMQHSEKRAETFVFTIPYFTNSYVIITRKGEEKELVELDELAVVEGYIFAEYAKAESPGIKLVEATSNLDALWMVATGKVEACGVSLPYASYLIDEHGLDSLTIAAKTGFLNRLSFGATRDNAPLVTLVDKALASFSSKERRNLHYRWIQLEKESAETGRVEVVLIILAFVLPGLIFLFRTGLGAFLLLYRKIFILVFSAAIIIAAAIVFYNRYFSISFSLKPEERKWLNENRLTLPACIEVPPMAFTNLAGEYDGMAIDLAELMTERLGIGLHWECVESYDAAVKKAIKGEISLLVAQETEERKKYFNFTRPVFSIPYILVTRQSNKSVVRLEDLSGKTVTVAKGYLIESYLKNSYPDIKLKTVPEPQAGLMQISMGESEYYVGNLAYVSWIIERLGITNLRSAGEVEFTNLSSIAVPKDKSILFSIIQRFVNSLSQQELDQIRDRWIHLDDEQALDGRVLVILTGLLLTITILILLIAFWNFLLRRTVHKQTETIRENEERLNLAMSVRNDGIWDWHFDTDDIYFDTRYYTMAGYEPYEFPQTYEEWEKRVHPDDYAGANKIIERIKAGESLPYDTEFRFRRKNGKYMWIRSRGMIAEVDEKGAPIRFIGTHSDITERKLATDALSRSEAEYRSTLDTLLTGIIVHDAEGLILYINPEACRILDLGAEQLMGDYVFSEKRAWKAYHEDFSPISENEFPVNVVLTSKKPLQNFVMGIKPEGDVDIKWINVSAIPVLKENGDTDKVVANFVDITELKQTEVKLRRARSYIFNIINSMPSILIGIDCSGRVTQWNNEAEKATGTALQQAIGSNLVDIYPQLAGDMDSVLKTLKSRKVAFFSKRNHHHQGELRFKDITVYPLVSDGDEGAVIRVDDITEKARLEEMMIQSEKMLSVGGLAAGMAHEINNPMAGIMQTASVLKNRLTNLELPSNIRAAEETGLTMDSIREFMRKREIPTMISNIYESGVRVTDIVDNTLSFSRKSEAEFANCDIADLMDKTLELAATDYNLTKQYDFKAIEVVREYDENLPMISCEKAKIQQVLLNLLRNGSQAMQDISNENDKTKPRFVLRLSCNRPEGMLKIEVEDNGPGMDDITRRRVFEPFFTTKPVGVGTGLGLSVSYFIITENHKGEMRVESSLGNGACFIIKLPLNPKN